MRWLLILALLSPSGFARFGSLWCRRSSVKSDFRVTRTEHLSPVESDLGKVYCNLYLWIYLICVENVVVGNKTFFFFYFRMPSIRRARCLTWLRSWSSPRHSSVAAASCWAWMCMRRSQRTSWQRQRRTGMLQRRVVSDSKHSMSIKQ